MGLGEPGRPFPPSYPSRPLQPAVWQTFLGQLIDIQEWNLSCSGESRQALGPSAPVLGGSEHPHQPEGVSQALDTQSCMARETEASSGDRSPQGAQGYRGSVAPCTELILRPPSAENPKLHTPPGASEALPAPRCSPEALGGPTEGAAPGCRLEAGWPSHTVSAGALTGSLLIHSLCLPSPHLTPPGFCRWALFFLGV